MFLIALCATGFLWVLSSDLGTADSNNDLLDQPSPTPTATPVNSEENQTLPTPTPSNETEIPPPTLPPTATEEPTPTITPTPTTEPTPNATTTPTPTPSPTSNQTTTETRYKISGYILDDSGNGITAAEIIFYVPDIIPAVLSNSSGYYEAYAPPDNYKMTVWPPFDSNYLTYTDQTLTIDTDVTKNVTLSVGYKVSGTITNSTGAPVSGALISLDNYFCGWYSNLSGHYFVTAPAGTYTFNLRTQPGTPPVYTEQNFTVNGNIIKNIVLNTTSNSTNPAPTPTPNPGQTAFKISGYIKDQNGNPIAGAQVSFNTQNLVPTVYTDATGYYAVYAPAGVYRINVLPPYDSNYIFYDLQGYVVGGADAVKNIVLQTGYKISGYITDSNGTPVQGALVTLNGFTTGWTSNYMGYYFVNVPAGTYRLSIVPSEGYSYPSYYEYNVTVNGDLTKNVQLRAP